MSAKPQDPLDHEHEDEDRESTAGRWWMIAIVGLGILLFISWMNWPRQPGPGTPPTISPALTTRPAE